MAPRNHAASPFHRWHVAAGISRKIDRFPIGGMVADLPTQDRGPARYADYAALSLPSRAVGAASARFLMKLRAGGRKLLMAKDENTALPGMGTADSRSSNQRCCEPSSNARWIAAA